MRAGLRLQLQLLIALSTAIPSIAKDDDGKIVSVTKDAIAIGKKHPNSYKLAAATLITLNGRTVTSAALLPGMRANVTAHAGVAASVDAVEDLFKSGSLKRK